MISALKGDSQGRRGMVYQTIKRFPAGALTNKGVDFITELPGQANEQSRINNGRRREMLFFKSQIPIWLEG